LGDARTVHERHLGVAPRSSLLLDALEASADRLPDPDIRQLVTGALIGALSREPDDPGVYTMCFCEESAFRAAADGAAAADDLAAIGTRSRLASRPNHMRDGWRRGHPSRLARILEALRELRPKERCQALAIQTEDQEAHSSRRQSLAEVVDCEVSDILDVFAAKVLSDNSTTKHVESRPDRAARRQCNRLALIETLSTHEARGGPQVDGATARMARAPRAKDSEELEDALFRLAACSFAIPEVVCRRRRVIG